MFEQVTMNDALTTVATALSAIIFPYFSKRQKELQERLDRQLDDLKAQNKLLLEKLLSLINGHEQEEEK